MQRDDDFSPAAGCVLFPKLILAIAATVYAFIILWKVHWLLALLAIGPVAGIIMTVFDLVFMPLFLIVMTPWFLRERRKQREAERALAAADYAAFDDDEDTGDVTDADGLPLPPR